MLPSNIDGYDYAALTADFNAQFPVGTTLTIKPIAGANQTYPPGWPGPFGTEWADPTGQGTTRLVRFRTGYFNMELDTRQMQIPHFAFANASSPGLTALLPAATSLHADNVFPSNGEPYLAATLAQITLTYTLAGVLYSCTGPTTGVSAADDGGYPVRLVKHGRFHIHLHVLDLVCQTSTGGSAPATTAAQLEMKVWPDLVQLDFHVADSSGGGSPLQVTAAIQVGTVTASDSASGAASVTARAALSVDSGGQAMEAGAYFAARPLPSVSSIRIADGLAQQVDADGEGAFVVQVPNRPSCAAGYHHQLRPGRDSAGASCDRFSVVLDNTGRLAGAARLRFFRAQGSGITGVTAVLHHMESVDGSNNPVASPVPGLAMALEGGGSGHFLQISKNWHTLSALHNAYWQDMITMLSVPADTKMTLQMTWHYGHALGSGGDGGEAFNKLPIHVVSHAMLSLIGWGTNGLWEEVGLGSNGESITYEPDNEQRCLSALDIRPFATCGINTDVSAGCGGMTFNSLGWTENVGGADMVSLWRPNGARVQPRTVESAYTATGPCLTNVTHGGRIAEGVHFRRQLSTSRTDDYVRHFHSFRMWVTEPTPVGRLALASLGANFYNYVAAAPGAPLLLAFGDKGGVSGTRLVAEDPVGAQRYDSAYDAQGPAEAVPAAGGAGGAGGWAGLPVWFSVSGGTSADHAGRPRVNRGLVVRGWAGSVGGQAVVRPHFRVVQHPKKAVLELVLPDEVAELRPGDHVEGELEILLPPALVEDTVAPSSTLRDVLERAASSSQPWLPVMEEATANNVEVNVTIGQLERAYPLRVRGAAGPTYELACNCYTLASFRVDVPAVAPLATRRSRGLVPVTVTGIPAWAKSYALVRRRGGQEQVVGGRADGHQVDAEPTAGGTHTLGELAVTYNLALLHNDSFVLRFEAFEAATANPTPSPYYTVETNLPPTSLAAGGGNPLRGFMTSPDWSPYPYQESIPSSLEYYYVGLSQLMGGANDFSGIDSYLEPRIAASASRSKHAVLRVILDYPGKASYVPQYLLDAGLAMTDYTDFGGGQSPDYASPLLLGALGSFIKELGRRYDGDTRVGFIQAGLLGFWGEWHTYPHTWIPDATKDFVVEEFAAAFNRTQIQLRYAFAPAAGRPRFGLHDDSFAHSTLDGAANGGQFFSWYFWPATLLAGMGEQWRLGAVGGEVRPELQATIFDADYPAGTLQKQDFSLCVTTTHATYLLNYYAMAGAGYTGTALENALAGHSLLGYAFVVRSVGAELGLSHGTVNLAVTVEQVGVAPFYYPLTLTAACQTQSGRVEQAAGGVEAVQASGDSGTFALGPFPATAQCLGQVTIALHSPYAYPDRPILFSQGADGKISVQLALPPTDNPTIAPTSSPTLAPTSSPTIAPTSSPTLAPTSSPTLAPTSSPTIATTSAPSGSPSSVPSAAPSVAVGSEGQAAGVGAGVGSGAGGDGEFPIYAAVAGGGGLLCLCLLVLLCHRCRSQGAGAAKGLGERSVETEMGTARTGTAGQVDSLDSVDLAIEEDISLEDDVEEDLSSKYSAQSQSGLSFVVYWGRPK